MPAQSLGRSAQKDCRERDDRCYLQQSVSPHGLSPAYRGNDALEDRRPHRARDINAAGDQRQRRPAVAVEPLADVDVERRINAAIADETDEQAVADQEIPWSSNRRDHQADAHHRGAEHHGPTNADALCDAPHHDAADADAHPAERACQRGRLARAAELGRNGFERHRRDPWRAE